MTTAPTPAADLHPAPNSAAIGAIARLSTATQALLIACGALSVVTIGTEAFGINAVSGYLNGNEGAIGSIGAYEQLSMIVNALSSVVLVATGVLWAVWQHRAAKQVPGRTRRSPGWHAGSWFVPIVSFWFPYQNISDLFRAIGRSRPSWLIVWWLLWVGSNISVWVSSRVYTTAEVLEQFRDAMWMSIVGELLLLAAAPLAWMVIRGITLGVLGRSYVPVISPADPD